MSQWSNSQELAPAPVAHGPEQAAAIAEVDIPVMADLRASADPYLRWAVLTRWRGFLRAQSQRGLTAIADPRADQQVRILAELKSPLDLEGLQRTAEPLPPPYAKAWAPGEKFRHVTATLSMSKLRLLLRELPKLRWELSCPRQDQRSDLYGTGKGYGGQQADYQAVPPVLQLDSKGNAKRSKQPQTCGVMAVIDFGCPLLHDVLGDASRSASRLTALWDQGDRRLDVGWQLCPTFAYGGELSAQQLREAWREVRQTVPRIDEAAAYAGLNYLIDYADPRRRIYQATHGAHVLDMAGGVVNPVDRSTDAASQAQLMFVQLPVEAASDSSGGSLSAYLLDALEFIAERAPAGEPLVVNVSYGTTAGPHDGTSLVEQAMDAWLKRRGDNTAIVLAAGNSRQAGLHVQRAVTPRLTALFRIAVAAADSTDTFVEFWYEAPRQPKCSLQFRARLPGGVWSGWLTPDTYSSLADPQHLGEIAMLVHQRCVPNGQRSMALLALRPTEAAHGDDDALAPPGLWEVEARLTGAPSKLSLTIDAWIERDDPRPFSGRRQTSFVGLEPTDEDNSLSSVASGELTIVVGGYRASDNAEVSYSSTGPRRRPQWPMTYAVCERDSVDQGLHAAAVRSGETLLMNGTSVAAPVMARQVFNAYCEAHASGGKLTRAQLLRALRRRSLQSSSLICIGTRA